MICSPPLAGRCKTEAGLICRRGAAWRSCQNTAARQNSGTTDGEIQFGCTRARQDYPAKTDALAVGVIGFLGANRKYS
jgi:hypothetical protein